VTAGRQQEPAYICDICDMCDMCVSFFEPVMCSKTDQMVSGTVYLSESKHLHSIIVKVAKEHDALIWRKR
jgi:hypothetical protein